MGSCTSRGRARNLPSSRATDAAEKMLIKIRQSSSQMTENRKPRKKKHFGTDIQTLVHDADLQYEKNSYVESVQSSLVQLWDSFSGLSLCSSLFPAPDALQCRLLLMWVSA